MTSAQSESLLGLLGISASALGSNKEAGVSLIPRMQTLIMISLRTLGNNNSYDLSLRLLSLAMNVRDISSCVTFTDLDS